VILGLGFQAIRSNEKFLLTSQRCKLVSRLNAVHVPDSLIYAFGIYRFAHLRPRPDGTTSDLVRLAVDDLSPMVSAPSFVALFRTSDARWLLEPEDFIEVGVANISTGSQTFEMALSLVERCVEHDECLRNPEIGEACIKGKGKTFAEQALR
jgi:hypothetical protein